MELQSRAVKFGDLVGFVDREARIDTNLVLATFRALLNQVQVQVQHEDCRNHELVLPLPRLRHLLLSPTGHK